MATAIAIAIAIVIIIGIAFIIIISTTSSFIIPYRHLNWYHFCCPRLRPHLAACHRYHIVAMVFIVAIGITVLAVIVATVRILADPPACRSFCVPSQMLYRFVAAASVCVHIFFFALLGLSWLRFRWYFASVQSQLN